MRYVVGGIKCLKYSVVWDKYYIVSGMEETSRSRNEYLKDI